MAMGSWFGVPLLLDDSSTTAVPLESIGVVVVLPLVSGAVVAVVSATAVVPVSTPPELVPSPDPDELDAPVPSPDAATSSPPQAVTDAAIRRVECSRPRDRMVSMLTRSASAEHGAVARCDDGSWQNTTIGRAIGPATVGLRADFLRVYRGAGPGTRHALRSGTMRHLPLSLLAASFALVLPACADDGEVDSSTSRGWRAMNMAVGESQDEWSTGVDAEGNLSLDSACAAGGTATITGSYDGENEYAVSIVFDGCTADGVVISGELALQASVELTDSSTSVSVSYGGELTWSGAAEGSCAIDVDAEITTSVQGTGADTTFDVDMEFHGEVCGYDASAVASASAELE